MNLLHAWIETPAATALGWTLVHSLWEGALAALALATALRVMRSAQARYAAGCAAMVVLAAAFAFTFAREMPEGPAHRAAHARPAGPGGLPEADLARRPDAAPSRDRTGYLPWLAAVWLAGVLGFQLRGVAAWMGARRLRGTGVCAAPGVWRIRLDRLAERARIARRVMLLESCLAEVPVVIGYLRPAILLPVGLVAGLPAAQVEAILLHELAHIRRRDYLVNVLQAMVESLLFYHPAVWWVSGVVRMEREHCCDDLVLEVSGNAPEYAAALTALEESRWAGEPAVAATGGNLMRRIHRILGRSEPPHAGLKPALSAALVLAVGVVALLVSAGAGDARPQATDKAAGTAYEKWLKQDVVYIIQDRERAAFQQLTTDEERDHFIEQFWERRNPTPGSSTNPFKEEHYRRIAFSNRHYADAAATPGWKTDRGRIYITFGPPDEIESHPKGGGAHNYPYEQWLYRWIEGVGNNVIVEFDDPSDNGEYRMAKDPNASR
jgi:GWxTD domain-containing protein